MKKFSFSKLLENNTFLIALSLFISVFIWFGVVFEDKEATTTVRNVPVIVDVEDSALARLQLRPVKENNFSVDVEIMGTSTTVGSIQPEDIKVVAKLNNIDGPGTYDVYFDGYDVHGKGFVVRSTTPESINMRFDYFTEKKFSVELDLSNLVIPEGHIMDQETVYPKEVSISGPETEISLINNVKASIKFDHPLAQTASYEVPIVLLDEEGKEISNSLVTLSDEKVSVTLPVLKEKRVPITLDYINIPIGFDVNTLKITIDPPTILLAGPVATVNNLTELHLGYIDVRTLEPNIELYYSTILPPGYISVENIQTINVKIGGENIDEKLLNVTNIDLINVPPNYDISIQTKTIYGVSVYGARKQLDSLTSKDVVAQVDISQVDVKTGSITVPVSVMIPGSNQCWAYGEEYTVVITVKRK